MEAFTITPLIGFFLVLVFLASFVGNFMLIGFVHRNYGGLSAVMIGLIMPMIGIIFHLM
jgi:hypothetical protein